MRYREQDGLPTRFGFLLWLLSLILLSATGLLGPEVDGEPLIPRPLGVGMTVFLLCCWLAALVFTLRTRATGRARKP